MIRVKSTREGLPGEKTSSGYIVDRAVSFVALPSEKALHRFVVIRNPLNGKSTIAAVLDVGPWNTEDPYVFQHLTDSSLPPGPEIRPLSETGHSISGLGTNGAGIDLGEAAWWALGLKDNTDVEWSFVNAADLLPHLNSVALVKALKRKLPLAA